jgi:prepilin-type N-terminal cleavage/methylation domain-containing protein
MPTSSVGKTNRVGRTPWSAADAPVGLPRAAGGYLHDEMRDEGVPRGPGGPPHLSRRGVTLVEMVVVVAIIALIVGLSFPAASAGLDNVRMVSACDGVATFLNTAVNRAERHQQPVELVVFPQEGRLALYSNEPGFTRELKMPDGVGIEAVLPAEEGGDPAQPRRILFLPGATVPGIAIQLVNRRNTHRRVRLDPMTGFPRVESVETK